MSRGPRSQPSGILAEYRSFLRHHKRWWLVPILVLVLLGAALLVVTWGSPLAPLMYSIF